MTSLRTVRPRDKRHKTHLASGRISSLTGRAGVKGRRNLGSLQGCSCFFEETAAAVKGKGHIFLNSQCLWPNWIMSSLGSLKEMKVLDFTQIPGRSTEGQTQWDFLFHTHVNTHLKTLALHAAGVKLDVMTSS